jgi:hypothetical protein
MNCASFEGPGMTSYSFFFGPNIVIPYLLMYLPGLYIVIVKIIGLKILTDLQAHRKISEESTMIF